MAPAFRASPTRKCATTDQIQALPVDQLAALAVGAAFSAGVTLLDCLDPACMAAWLAANT
jgi:hypothetical protein